MFRNIEKSEENNSIDNNYHSHSIDYQNSSDSSLNIHLGTNSTTNSNNHHLDEIAVPQKSVCVEGILDTLVFVCDILGWIPGIGEPFDVISAFISLLRGDIFDFMISMTSTIPVVRENNHHKWSHAY